MAHSLLSKCRKIDARPTSAAVAIWSIVLGAPCSSARRAASWAIRRRVADPLPLSQTGTGLRPKTSSHLIPSLVAGQPYADGEV